MKQKIVIKASFWRRLIAGGIDMIIVFLLSYLVLFLSIKTTKTGMMFRENYLFYIWVIWTIILFLIEMIIIPIYTKGQSFGYKIMGIKIITTNNKIIRSIVYREIFFTFAWIFIMSLVAIVINHTLIFQLAKIKGGADLSKQLTLWQKTRISLVGSIGGLLIFLQMILAITIMPNKEGQGFHDKSANAKVVCTRVFKWVEEPKKITFKYVAKRKIKQLNLEFQGEWNKNDIEW